MNNNNEILDRYENNLLYKQEFINKNNILKLKIDILNKRIKKNMTIELDFNDMQKYEDLIENYTEEYKFNIIKIEKITTYIKKDKELLNSI